MRQVPGRRFSLYRRFAAECQQCGAQSQFGPEPLRYIRQRLLQARRAHQADDVVQDDRFFFAAFRVPRPLAHERGQLAGHDAAGEE